MIAMSREKAVPVEGISDGKARLVTYSEETKYATMRSDKRRDKRSQVRFTRARKDFGKRCELRLTI